MLGTCPNGKENLEMSEKLKKTPDQTQPRLQNKQEYSTPILVEYGDIRELTKAAAGKVGVDGATAGNNKTA